MTYIHPKPENAFTLFRDETLSKEIIFEHNLWLFRFYREEFADHMQRVKPYAFCLNTKKKDEPSLLLYKTVFKGYKINILENYNAFMMSIKKDSYNYSKGINSDIIVDFLLEMLQINMRNKEDAIKMFNLPAKLKEGDVFTNSHKASISLIKDWKNYVIGFIGKDSIYIILFKAYPERAQLGFPYDFDWLNKGLFSHELPPYAPRGELK